MKGIEIPTKQASGTIRVSGHIRGYVSGIVDADIDGIIHGQFNAALSTDSQVTEEGGIDHA